MQLSSKQATAGCLMLKFALFLLLLLLLLLLDLLLPGVPVIADAAFLSAYSMMEPAAVFQQQPGESELDAMFRAAAQPAEQMWRTRAAVQQLRRKMNSRSSSLILRWLLDRGLVPNAASDVAKIM
jgi:hypothetical protein